MDWGGCKACVQWRSHSLGETKLNGRAIHETFTILMNVLFTIRLKVFVVSKTGNDQEIQP